MATRYQYQDAQGEIGVISSVTDSFCSNCSRARLSAEGSLYTCLFATEGTDLRELLRSGQDDAAIIKCITNVWETRNDRYSDERNEQTMAKEKRQKLKCLILGVASKNRKNRHNNAEFFCLFMHKSAAFPTRFSTR